MMNISDLNLDDYKDIHEKRGVYYDSLMYALGIVEKFIKDNKRIIYGGMAIDFALKLAGEPGIYSDNIIPDYDFYTNDHLNDSNKLAIILYNADLPDAYVHNTAHVTARKVKVNNTEVADVAHVPKKIYNKLPTLMYKGIRIVHPLFQRLDIHKSLMNSYETPPLEPIFFRGMKDLKRFNMLDAAYPVIIPSKTLGLVNNKKTAMLKINKKVFNGGLIGGVPAYGILYTAIKDIIYNELDKDLKTLFDKCAPVIVNTSGPDIIMSYLSNMPILNRVNIISEKFADKEKELNKLYKIHDTMYYKQFLEDTKPLSTELYTKEILFDIHDSRGRLIPCKNGVAAVHCILLYFLTRYFIEDKNDMWLFMYWSCLQVQKIYNEVSNNELYNKSDNKSLSKLDDLPYTMVPTVYGSHNWSYTYMINFMKSRATIYPEYDIQDVFKLRPMFSYTPARSLEYDDFDTESSFLYTMDGSKLINMMNI